MFVEGKQDDFNLALRLIESFLDVYERVKYQKFLKNLSKAGIQGRKAGEKLGIEFRNRNEKIAKRMASIGICLMFLVTFLIYVYFLVQGS